jgi:hypothetical protein
MVTNATFYSSYPLLINTTSESLTHMQSKTKSDKEIADGAVLTHSNHSLVIFMRRRSSKFMQKHAIITAL